jgi:hypothetical protein
MKFRSIKNILIIALLFVMLLLSINTVAAQGGEDARIGVFEEFEIKPGGRVEVPVEVRGVEDLYAIDLEIRFDPAVITIEDGNPDKAGIQPASGTFLDPGLAIFNEVDNEIGIVHFVMTQVNPSEGKSGDGIILVLYCRGVAEGESELTMVTVDISTREGELIPSEPVNAMVVVKPDAEEKEATPIPVQETREVEDVPTAAATEITPSPTATPTMEPEAEEEPTEESVVLSTDTPEPSVTYTPVQEQEEIEEPSPTLAEDEGPATEQSGFSLLDNWWIVAVVIALALGLGVYLWVTKV